MCPRRDFFESYKPYSGSSVLIGNDVVCQTSGVGTVKIKMFDGIVRTLTDVRHVPDLKKNLISLGTLDAAGCKFTTVGGVMRVSKGAMVVMLA
jgi:hypothetical protein